MRTRNASLEEKPPSHHYNISKSKAKLSIKPPTINYLLPRRHSIPLYASTPTATSRSRSGAIVALPRSGLPLLVPPRRTAAEKHDHGAEQQAHGGGQDRPNRNAVRGMRPRGVVVVAVDVVAQHGEEHKVDDEGDERQQEGEQRDDGSEEGADEAGAQGEEEGDEGEGQDDRVQDHGFGERVGRGGGRVGEVGRVDAREDRGRVVADVRARAVVMVVRAGLGVSSAFFGDVCGQAVNLRCVDHTVPKCAELNLGLVARRGISKVDLQKAKVVYHRC